jgi:hypothetical protein
LPSASASTKPAPRNGSAPLATAAPSTNRTAWLSAPGAYPPTPRTARIITALLTDDPKPWDLQNVGAVGLQVLAAATCDTAAELRERLLERGFHEAVGS